MDEPENPFPQTNNIPDKSDQTTEAHAGIHPHSNEPATEELNQIAEYQKPGRFRRTGAAVVAGLGLATLFGSAAKANQSVQAEPIQAASTNVYPNQNETQPAGSEVKPDVPFNSYGKDGHPAPKLIPLESHDPITKEIQTVPSNNPYELAQQAIWLAAHPESYQNRLSVLGIWGGYIELKESTFYHALKGSKTFTPTNPSNNGEAGKITLGPDQVALIKTPVFLSFYKDASHEPDYIMATLESGSSTVTDVNNVYFVPLGNESQNQTFLASKRFYNPSFGLAELPTGIPSIGHEGMFRSGAEQPDQISKILILSKEEAQKKLEQIGLVKAQPPSPSG